MLSESVWVGSYDGPRHFETRLLGYSHEIRTVSNAAGMICSSSKEIFVGFLGYVHALMFCTQQEESDAVVLKLNY